MLLKVYNLDVCAFRVSLLEIWEHIKRRYKISESELIDYINEYCKAATHNSPVITFATISQ